MRIKSRLKFYKDKTKGLFLKPDITNIYHASVQKSGSQWLKQVFNDKVIVKYTKLALYPQHRYEWTEFKSKFPRKTFVPGLYISYQSYEEIIKPERYKTIYVIRDPRELIVSWYYSMKFSHGLMGKVYKHRKNLNNMNEDEGIMYCINHFQLKLSFMKDWVLNCNDENVVFVRFEDLTKKPKEEFSNLFQNLGIKIEEEVLHKVLDNYSKDKMRKRQSATKVSKQTKHSHYRDKPTGWKEMFNDEHIKQFKSINGNVVEILGYSWGNE